MALLGDKLKILRFNPDLEDYMNKNFGYSKLYDLRTNAYEK